MPEPLEKLKALYEDWGDGDYTGHAEFFHPEMTTETFGMGDPIRADSYEGFVEVIPNRRVVFTWGWEARDAAVGPGGSTVEIDLEPRGHGTRLHLVHRGLPAAELASHTVGWDHFLPRLSAVAEGRSVPTDV